MPEDSRTLSQLLRQVGEALGRAFPEAAWVVAEILEIHENRSGHCYLELVEKSDTQDRILARARGTIWASRYRMLRSYFEASTNTTLKSGIKLLIRASVEFHPQYGFSLNITDLDPSYTLGDLAQKKQEVIRKLREAGVMEMNRELPFPTVPQSVAVISSETAAGFGDFMDSLHGNQYGFYFRTVHFQAVMQGEEAPASIIHALERIFESEETFDCVALIRGGGSRADLECFNDYELAYTLTQFPLPVLTGIGHERDESVADMVAAIGLKTPTAVAEYLVNQLLAFEFRLSELDEKISAAVIRSTRSEAARLERYRSDLSHLGRRFLREQAETLRQHRLSLARACAATLERKREQLLLLETRNKGVDPVRILSRGYSMTLLQGKAVTDTGGIQPGSTLETRLYRGTLFSEVTRVSPERSRKQDGSNNEDITNE